MQYRNFAIGCMLMASQLAHAAAPSASELGELYDRARIEEIVIGFEVAHDSTDAKRLGEMLATDAQIIENGQVLMTGRDTIVANITKDQARLNPGVPPNKFGTLRHFMSNIEITLHGNDTATVTAYCLVTGYNKSGKRPDIVSIGEYLEEFVKRDGKWQLKKLTMTIEQGNEGMAKELELGPYNPQFKDKFKK